MDQWNKIESSEIDRHNIVNLSWPKGQRQYNGAKIVSSANHAKTTGQPQAQQNKSRHRPYTLHKS